MDITIQELHLNECSMFWQEHYNYLLRDGLILDAEDAEYFQSDEYRGIIEAHMQRKENRHHLLYFLHKGQRIGAASCCVYTDEGGKCQVLDFWVFEGFRNRGCGHACFHALVEYMARFGAEFYEINCDGRADRLRFWTGEGFVPNGRDEYDEPLYIRR